jgi:hypothetical protein
MCEAASWSTLLLDPARTGALELLPSSPLSTRRDSGANSGATNNLAVSVVGLPFPRLAFCVERPLPTVMLLTLQYVSCRCRLFLLPWFLVFASEELFPSVLQGDLGNTLLLYLTRDGSNLRVGCFARADQKATFWSSLRYFAPGASEVPFLSCLSHSLNGWWCCSACERW